MPSARVKETPATPMASAPSQYAATNTAARDKGQTAIGIDSLQTIAEATHADTAARPQPIGNLWERARTAASIATQPPMNTGGDNSGDGHISITWNHFGAQP